MADAHLIDSLESVSLHLSAIEELADAICDLPQQHTLHPYGFILVFSLLSQAASGKLNNAMGAARNLQSLQNDMRSLAHEAR